MFIKNILVISLSKGKTELNTINETHKFADTNYKLTEVF